MKTTSTNDTVIASRTPNKITFEDRHEPDLNWVKFTRSGSDILIDKQGEIALSPRHMDALLNWSIDHVPGVARTEAA